nr:NAD(P)H-quinone oxidoreductase subunit T, chloroplastic [Tanacetum cinerariifolium]
MLSQGCLDWDTEVLYAFMRQQSEKGKGGRKHHQELIPESIGRLKMKGVLVASRNATWPINEEEQKNNLLGEKFTELVNNSTDSHYWKVCGI